MFDILFIIVPIFMGIVFIFTFAMILSPKLRGKMMSRQFKSMKYMLDDSKDTLEDVVTDMGNMAIKTKKRIIDENEDVLKDLSKKNADIYSPGIEATARAIKKGLTDDIKYCKYCGEAIDMDSNFCKSCGKKQ